MHGMCEWVIQQGLRLLEKYFTMEARNTASSVDMVITLLLHGMVDVACSMLPPEILSAKIHVALEDISRRMLGSMVQQARKHHLDVTRAASFNDAWTKLQAMKRSLVAKAKKEKKGPDNSVQKVCKLPCISPWGQTELEHVWLAPWSVVRPSPCKVGCSDIGLLACSTLKQNCFMLDGCVLVPATGWLCQVFPCSLSCPWQRVASNSACTLIVPFVGCAPQGRTFYFLQRDQVELGEVLSKGSFGTVRKVMHIASRDFPAYNQYVAKLMTDEKGRTARKSLATEATNLACLSHPSLVLGLGMTLTEPCMLVMEYWPHGHLGRYW